MAIETIPLFSDTGKFRYSIVIDGVGYVFRFRFLVRSESWYLDILAEDETPIRTGIRLVDQWFLTVRDRLETLFDGQLIVVRLDDGSGWPTENDFDGSVSLLLITGEDLEGEDTTSGGEFDVVVVAA